MSTRATIHFEHPANPNVPEAIVYRHSDGYPDGLGHELVEFIRRLKAEVKDHRLNDPSYLAAKWVVYDVMRHHAWQADWTEKQGNDAMRRYYGDPNLLNFLGVGIVNRDPGDIEFRYHVVCDGRVRTIDYDGGYGDMKPLGKLTTAVEA